MVGIWSAIRRKRIAVRSCVRIWSAKLANADYDVLPTKCRPFLTSAYGRHTSAPTFCVYWVYNTVRNSWKFSTKMPLERMNHGSVCIKRFLFVVGGEIAGCWSDSVQYVDEKIGKWRNGPLMPTAYVSPKVAEIKGDIYLLAEKSKRLVKMEMRKQKWIKLAPFPFTEDNNEMAMLAVNNQLLVAVGFSTVCAWYRPETNTWSLGRPPIYPSMNGSLVQYNNSVFLVGCATERFGIRAQNVLGLNDEKWIWSAPIWKLPLNLCGHQALTLKMPYKK